MMSEKKDKEQILSIGNDLIAKFTPEEINKILENPEMIKKITENKDPEIEIRQITNNETFIIFTGTKNQYLQIQKKINKTKTL